MQKNWHILSPDLQRVSLLVETLGCLPAIATALVNRGMFSPNEASAFLKPSLAHIRSPFSMKGIHRAVDRILAAIRAQEKILIFGDYDADGITATALLLEFLRTVEADVDYYIPNRLTEGYGFSREYVEKQAIPNGVSLIITVDCGIGSHRAVAKAQQAAIDVIITDHHEAPVELPEAQAVLNPKQPHCGSGFSWLAGVGVAFNLVMALRKKLREDGYWKKGQEPNLKAACDLVAIGTVADMVPLMDENRIFVKAGLEVLASHPRPGIQALLKVCNLANRHLDSQDLSYRIAPRLNAPGRLGRASTALSLLTAPDILTAYPLAEDLNQENARRQAIESDMVSEINQHLDTNPTLLERKALVLDSDAWHQGVVGIVASRLVDRYHRPAVVIAISDGVGKGSARSPDGFNLYDGLSSCSKHLEKFGGHPRAAGLTLKPENIPAFREDFERTVARKTKPEDLTPRLIVDGELGASEISNALADALEAFSPFGTGNPEPLFLLSNMKVVASKVVGTGHLQMRLRSRESSGADVFQAIYFNGSSKGQHLEHIEQVLCHVRWNRWGHSKKIQLVIRDLEAGH